MSFKVFIVLTIISFVATVICAVYTIICLRKEFSLKSSKLSILISIGSLLVTLLASFQVKIPSPIILPLDSEVKIYDDNTKISIKSDDNDCTIYYSLDGSDPKNDGIKYNGSFLISDSTTVCARSKFWWFWSDIEQCPYEFNQYNTKESDEINTNPNVYGNQNFVNTGIIGDVTVIFDKSSIPEKTESQETKTPFLNDFGQSMRYIFNNETIIKEKIINNKENKPIYSSIYSGVSYYLISDTIRVVEIINNFRNIECSRIYYFDENEKLTFALMCDNEGEHRLYFYNDILIRYKDTNGNDHDINKNLDEPDCKWTNLVSEESYEILNGVKKSSNVDDITVTASYNPNTPQTSQSGVNILVSAITSFPADYVTISAISDKIAVEPIDMHGGKYEWHFTANFYIKGTYIVTITAYNSEGKNVSDSFEYVY